MIFLLLLYLVILYNGLQGRVVYLNYILVRQFCFAEIYIKAHSCYTDCPFVEHISIQCFPQCFNIDNFKKRYYSYLYGCFQDKVL